MDNSIYFPKNSFPKPSDLFCNSKEIASQTRIASLLPHEILEPPEDSSLRKRKRVTFDPSLEVSPKPKKAKVSSSKNLGTDVCLYRVAQIQIEKMRDTKQKISQLLEDLEVFDTVEEVISETELLDDQKEYLDFILKTKEYFQLNQKKDEKSEEETEDPFFDWLVNQRSLLDERLVPYDNPRRLFGHPLERMKTLFAKKQLASFVVEELKKAMNAEPLQDSTDILQIAQNNIFHHCQESRRIARENEEFLSMMQPFFEDLKKAWETIHASLIEQHSRNPLAMKNKDLLEKILDQSLTKDFSGRLPAHFQEEEKKLEWSSANQEKIQEFLQLLPSILKEQRQVFHRYLEKNCRSKKVLAPDFEKFYPFLYERMLEVLWVEYSGPISLPDYVETFVKITWPLWRLWKTSLLE